MSRPPARLLARPRQLAGYAALRCTCSIPSPGGVLAPAGRRCPRWRLPAARRAAPPPRRPAALLPRAAEAGDDSVLPELSRCLTAPELSEAAAEAMWLVFMRCKDPEVRRLAARQAAGGAGAGRWAEGVAAWPTPPRCRRRQAGSGGAGGGAGRWAEGGAAWPTCRQAGGRAGGRAQRRAAPPTNRPARPLHPPTPPPQVNELMSRGVSALGAHDLPSALEAFEQVVAMAPSFAEGHNKRATCLYLMQRYQESIHACKVRRGGRAAGQPGLPCCCPRGAHWRRPPPPCSPAPPPARPPAHARRAALSPQLAIELNPFHFGAISGMGLCHVNLGQREEAISAFEAALKLNPGLETIAMYIKQLKRES